MSRQPTITKNPPYAEKYRTRLWRCVEASETIRFSAKELDNAIDELLARIKVRKDADMLGYHNAEQMIIVYQRAAQNSDDAISVFIQLRDELVRWRNNLPVGIADDLKVKKVHACAKALIELVEYYQTNIFEPDIPTRAEPPEVMLEKALSFRNWSRFIKKVVEMSRKIEFPRGLAYD